jgi:hypothetical protein
MKWLSKVRARVAAHIKALAKPYSREERSALTVWAYDNGEVTLAEDGSYEWTPKKAPKEWPTR